MPLRLICPNLRCRKLLAVPEDARGKVVTCQFCRAPFRVPGTQGAGQNTPQVKSEK